MERTKLKMAEGNTQSTGKGVLFPLRERKGVGVFRILVPIMGGRMEPKAPFATSEIYNSLTEILSHQTPIRLL